MNYDFLTWGNYHILGFYHQLNDELLIMFYITFPFVHIRSEQGQ
jgi:hypothetical protein